tara:strand:- start:1365 stop:2816 length:1452 start_codon:yes stop_codon:yes gene_type:complete
LGIDLTGSATALLRKIREKTISAVDLLETQIQRIESLNPKINGVVFTDVDQARTRAKAADEATRNGEWWGPLHGLPMTVKDAFEVEGMVSTGGSSKWKDHIPDRHSDAVQRLVDAGAIIFGKTNVPSLSDDFQTYNELYGTTNNPWDHTRTPGGSSGGAAAALAAGMTPLELGSDIGGSIRIPAHFCGVYGHKPSYGLISMRGHIPPPPGFRNSGDTLSVAGPLARSSADLEVALSVLAGPKTDDCVAWRLALPPPRHKNLKDFRVAVWPDDQHCPIENKIVNTIRKVADQLANSGASVEETHPDFTLEKNNELYWSLLSPVISTSYPKKVIEQLKEILETSSPDDTSPHVQRARFALIPHREWLSANEHRHRLKGKWHQFFQRWDVLICPTTIVTAFKHLQSPRFIERELIVDGETRPYIDLMVWAGLAVNSQLPATNVPVGLDIEGLPVGIQIIGPYLEDRTTIQFGELLERVTDGFVLPL